MFSAKRKLLVIIVIWKECTAYWYTDMYGREPLQKSRRNTSFDASFNRDTWESWAKKDYRYPSIEASIITWQRVMQSYFSINFKWVGLRDDNFIRFPFTLVERWVITKFEEPSTDSRDNDSPIFHEGEQDRLPICREEIKSPAVARRHRVIAICILSCRIIMNKTSRSPMPSRARARELRSPQLNPITGRIDA